MAQNIDNLPADVVLKDRINEIGQSDKFKAASGSGKNAQRRIPELLGLGEQYFGK